MQLTFKLNVLHRLVQISFVLLILLLIVWFGFWFPSDNANPYLLALIWVSPLLLAVFGVMKKKLYTYSWLQFINMIYFCHAVVVLMTNSHEFNPAMIELFLVMTNFFSVVFCVQLTKKIALRRAQTSKP